MQKITGLDKQFFKCKTVNIFLPIHFNICFGCSKELSHYVWLRKRKFSFSLPSLKRTKSVTMNIFLIETVLLSTHNICFG